MSIYPLAEAVSKLCECQLIKAAVRTQGVVVRPPFLNDPSCCSQRGELVLRQGTRRIGDHLSFRRAILLRFARRDVMLIDPGVLAPGENGVIG